MPDHHHRAGSLRQSNKRNKRSTTSKWSLTRLAGGKVEGRRRVAFKQRLVTHTKADRRHMEQQRRDAKRQELLQRKRGLDGGPLPPRIVGIISLSKRQTMEERFKLSMVEQADWITSIYGKDANISVMAKYDLHKKDGNLTILTNTLVFCPQYTSNKTPNDAAVLGALDLCRVCDIVLFVLDADARGRQDETLLGMNIGGGDDPSTSHYTHKMDASSQERVHLISAQGDRILAAVKAQGLPRVIKVYGGDIIRQGDFIIQPQSEYKIGERRSYYVIR